MLAEIEQSRLSLSKSIDSKRKSRLGQFFTPATIAQFMAKMFDSNKCEVCHLLDAGAGIGSLSVAFLDRWISGDLPFQRVELDAFEIDTLLYPFLSENFKKYLSREDFSLRIYKEDFIHTAANCLSNGLFKETLPKYTHAILNPPYKKIRSDSAYRTVLRLAGIETVNLYSAFVALSLALLDNHGQLVAIIPRSFCNGPYYLPFRKFVLKQASVEQIHLFESRNKAFSNDNVLQENIIIRLERGGQQKSVVISASTDDSFADLDIYEHPIENIISPDDSDKFIHIPLSSDKNALDLYPSMRYSLDDLNINVSTGPVVDFRVKKHLRDMPEADAVPLLYPGHFDSSGIKWPRVDFKKANAIKCNNETKKWLYPNGFYCVVRRLSSKEENRRVVASIVEPSFFSDADLLGFENHLNVFHNKKGGLQKELAYGLFVYLNSTAVDKNLRKFNGHTQINATDLKAMKYPSRAKLISLGGWALKQNEFTQEVIDKKMESFIE